MKYFTFLIFLFFASFIIGQVPNYVPQNGLLSYWPFSGNANDVSANASHLTNNGAVLTLDRFGNANSAYSFNGTNQSMVRTTPNFTFTSTSSFTISAWVYKSSTAGGVAMINGTTAAGNFIWLLQGGAASMTYGTNKQQQAWIYLNAPFAINTWEHYVCVYESGTMRFYKNNVLEGTAPFTYTAVTSANMPLYIGQGISGSYFNGRMDDIGIWNRALTTCEINDLFTSAQTLTTVNAGADISICAGQSVTLNGSGANAYLWNQGVTNGVSFTPTASQTYTLTGTDINGCSAWDQVNVNFTPTTLNAGADTTLCNGNSIVLTGSGGTGLSWNNGVIAGVPFVPASNQTYTLSGTDLNGCVTTDQITVTLYQPNVNAGADVSICEGASVTLTATGAATYVWANGNSNGAPFVPLNSGYYSVTGIDNAGCSKTDSLLITLKPLPNVQGGPDLDICPGDFITLSGSGGLFYTWSNGVFNNVPFVPLASNAYVVTGTGSNNCTNKDTVQVTINLPTSSTLNINAIDQYVLNGTTYIASGTYTQVVQNAGGCDSTITLVLNLNFTGLAEVDALKLKWFPNPTSDILNLTVDAEHLGKQLYMYSSDGKMVKTVVLVAVQTVVDVRELNVGVYSCRLEGKEAPVFKWLKQ